METLVVRKARKEDCHDIIVLIKELSAYEKLEHMVKITAEQLIADGFGEGETFFQCVVAEIATDAKVSLVDQTCTKSRLVGYALYFFTYSTFEGRSSYLEDIYVTPDYRGKGIGTRMINAVAQAVVDKGCCRMDFTVLKWNTPSIKYYENRGAVNLTDNLDWHLFRFTRDSLEIMAKETSKK